MESKQHARKKRVAPSYMCFWCTQTQFLVIYITFIINFFIEKHVLFLDIAASVASIIYGK